MNSRLVWLWALCVMLALGGCGGGSNKSDSTPTVSTTAVSRTAAVFADVSLFDITGTNLNRVTVTSDDCEELTIPARNNQTIVVSCLPSKAALTFEITDNRTGEVIATATGSAALPANLTVTGVTVPSNLQIGKPQQFVIQGTNLLNSTEEFLNILIDSTLVEDEGNRCGEITLVSKTDTAITFTCVPNHPTMTLFIRHGATEELLRQEVLPTVPLPRVTMTTSLGDIVVELSPIEAPNSVVNFLKYVNSQYYDGTIFHRLKTFDPLVANSFGVNQGGGFTSKDNANSGTAKPGLRNPIPLETTNLTGLSNVAGTIAVARLPDDHDNNPSTPINTRTATSQFYFNVSDNSGSLDAVTNTDGTLSRYGYAVFGRVITGLDVLDDINASPRTTGNADLPETDVVIQSVVQTQ